MRVGQRHNKPMIDDNPEIKNCQINVVSVAQI